MLTVLRLCYFFLGSVVAIKNLAFLNFFIVLEEEEKRKSVNRFGFFSRFELRFKSVLSLVYFNFLIVDIDKFKFSRF